MAEILGIAAAAAQFLTIAVKLSVKLNWICSEVHHAPKRLQDLRKSLDQQITLIKNIAETDFYGSAIVAAKKADFIHVLGEYQDIIQRLLDLLQRLLDQDDKGIIRKGWNSILTLHKTDEILLLCSRIEEKRDLVLLWLSDINLAQSTRSHTAIEKALKVSLQAQSTTEEIATRIDQMHPLVEDINDKASATKLELKANMTQGQRILDEIERMNLEMRRLSDEYRNQSLSGFRELLTSNRYLQDTVHRTAVEYSQGLDSNVDPVPAMYSILNDIHRNTNQKAIQNSERRGVRQRHNMCQCRSFSQSEQWEPLSILHFKRVFVRHHHRQCPKSQNSDRSLEVMMKIIPPPWLLRYTINLSMVVHNWRVGQGFKISPIVVGAQRTVCRDKSLSFRAIENTRKKLEDDFKKSPLYIKDLINTLKDLFDTQKASALDVGARGVTLLHEILWLYTRHDSWGVRKFGGRPGEEYLALIRFMLASGANPNVECALAEPYLAGGRICRRNGTVLDVFASGLTDPNTCDLGSMICDEIDSAGGQFSRPLQNVPDLIDFWRAGHFGTEVSELLMFPEQVDLCDLGPLVPTIITRSEEDFTRILRRYDVNHASRVNGLTAPHFAVYWPFALRSLIEAGADVDCADHYDRRPIHLAVELHLPEAVDILIKADCALWSPMSLWSLYQSVLTSPIHDGISHAVIGGIIDRLRRLFHLSATMLLEDSSLQQRIRGNMLDETLAPVIIKELTSSGVQLPPALHWDGRSIFDSADMHGKVRVPTHVADRFWDAGFRNVAGFDAYGFLPILHSWFAANFEMVSWLVSKGVPLFSQHRDNQMCGLHLYAHRLACPGDFFQNDANAVPSPSRELGCQLWEQPHLVRDCCSCMCSPQGCSPVSMLVKGDYIYKMFHLRPPAIDVEGNAKLLTIFWEKTEVPLHLRQAQMEDLLRLTVFDTLGFKHTCCLLDQFGYPYADHKRKHDPVDMCSISDGTFIEKLESCLKRMSVCKCQGADKVPCALSSEESCRSVS